MKSGSDPIDMTLRTFPVTASRYLACPKCRSDIEASPDGFRCTRCGFSGRIDSGVFVAGDVNAPSNFDVNFATMRVSNHAPGTWELFYERQVKYVEQHISAGQLVIDVGCGPELVYRKNGALVIGVDASLASVRENHDADIAVYGSAAALPVKDRIADAIVCFYSVHHMTGNTVYEHRGIVSRVFGEFARVLKPGGALMIFDVSPRWPFDALENAAWNLGRKIIGPGLDMYFWKDSRLREVGAAAFPQLRLETLRFGGAHFTTFPPIFSKPWLRLPRLLYPFDINLYRWRA